MGKEKRGGPLALELWAKQLIDGYRGVSVRNMTTSWRNGMAFCALIHRFRPDLIDYEKLDPSDIIGNCSLAFEIAETKLGIPSLLDPEDMVSLEIPDRLSILTYVAQFYNAFKNVDAKPRISTSPVRRDLAGADSPSPDGKDISPSPERKVVNKRKSEINTDEIMDKVKRSMPKRSVLLSTSSVCSECNNPVFISERVIFMKKLYHRSCFCCTNCKNPLNPHLLDISPDGSLYCLEKTCHAELLKNSDISSISNRSDLGLSNEQSIPSVVPDKNDTSSYNANTTLNNSIRNSKEAEEALIKDATEDTNVAADTQSQGDVQCMSDQRAVQEPFTPRNNRKFMDFAGSLMHDYEDPVRTSASEHCTGDFVVTEETKFSEDRPDESTEPCLDEEPVEVALKPTPEITCIREQAILTVADQIKSSSVEEETLENKDNKTEQTDVGLEDATNIKESEDTTSELSEECKPPTFPNDSSRDDEEKDPTKPEDPKNPFAEKEEAPEESHTTTPTIVTSSPVPKKRPPKPPPPKFSSPSPIPRPRSVQNRDSVEVSKEPKELWKNKDYYPSELNPFEDSEENFFTKNDNKPTEPKNPFEDDEVEAIPSETKPKPRPRTAIPNAENSGSPALSPKIAANFNVPPPRPPLPQATARKPNPAFAKPYNPFEDDEDDIGEYEDQGIHSLSHSRGTDDTCSISSKASELSSSISGAPTPTPRSLNTSDTEGTGSFKLRSRKARRAPLPPAMTRQQPNGGATMIKGDLPVFKKVVPVPPNLLKGLGVPSPNAEPLPKRKKRRAPPPKRRVEPLPEEAIRTEFADLEVQLKELERQGIALETKIRSMMEEMDEDPEPVKSEELGESMASSTAEDSSNQELLDEMMIQLWNIVNEKNEILRRQTELEYLRRGHRLEEEQAELEFKLRILMDTPEDQRQFNQEDMEQALLQNLLKLVDERNEVVEWLDYHRQKDREEEILLTQSITEFSNLNKTGEVTSGPTTKSKHKDKKSKTKEGKDKTSHSKLKLGLFKKKSKKVKPEAETEAK